MRSTSDSCERCLGKLASRAYGQRRLVTPVCSTRFVHPVEQYWPELLTSSKFFVLQTGTPCQRQRARPKPCPLTCKTLSVSCGPVLSLRESAQHSRPLIECRPR